MKLVYSIFSTSAINCVSRCLGFMRDMLVAQIFGAELYTDSFFLAFKFPNHLHKIFSDGACSHYFFPVLVNYKHHITKRHSIKNFFANFLGITILVMFIITTLGIIFAEEIVSFIAPGFSNNAEKFHFTVFLLRTMFPYIFISALISLVASTLNTWNYFFIPATSALVFNMTIIFIIIVFSSFLHFPIFSLAWGILIGRLSQLLYQIPSLQEIDMCVQPTIQIKNIRIFAFIKKILFIFVCFSIGQISLVFNSFFASLIPIGSVSWLYYADRIIEFPTSIFGNTFGIILLPTLSKKNMQKNEQEYSALLDWGIRTSIILSLPCTIITEILSYPMVMTIFQYGQFDEYDTFMTSRALSSYSFGIVAIILSKVLTPAFYSRGNITIPIKANIMSIIITQFISTILVNKYKHVGLALSTSLGAWIHVFILVFYLYKYNIFTLQPGWGKFLMKMIISSSIMISFLLITLPSIEYWINELFISKVIYLLILIITSLFLYFSSLFLFKRVVE
ncbi:murein biosynthesis integral membrane protein MurJ [Buchnera aphidicola (Thelaxes californica)]|uniref:Probable lipid II flippase MurJ n=1 Tax=Buchnera aphidicola (Thelaxes californica) TaxID=1315998 RepID=A0A4D6YBP1_9GAMM|nr:murein biosynthesis integral membrane protein MurJ [Buchnera aphidicola]QCI26789.1 murein biosynthesis integral membrane protein MurJ [Buchnera aphidicola (Thelaxes californica)]